MFNRSIKRGLMTVLAGVGVLATALLAATQPALAYKYLGLKQAFSYGDVIPYKWGNLTNNESTWTEMFRKAGYNWATAQNKFQWGATSSSSNIQQMYYLVNSNEFGRTQASGTMGGFFDWAWMEVNQYSVTGKSWNFQVSVAGHELGHGLGLADENTVSPALMNQNRNRDTIVNPQADDLNGTNALY